MIITKCLVASDLNPTYYTFFPLVKQFWKKMVGINTTMILIGNEIPNDLRDYKDNIILFKPIDGVSTAFQSQCIRILYPCLYENEYIIISDMDLIPLNSKYYTCNVEKYDNDNFIIYRDVISEHQQYPICFCLAKGSTWKEIFNINDENDIRERIKEWYSEYNDYSISSPYSQGWAGDQLKLFKYVNEWREQHRVQRLKDENTGFNRLDRKKDIDEWFKKYYRFVMSHIKGGIWSDFHLPRPIRNYRTVLELLQEVFISDSALFDDEFSKIEIVRKMDESGDYDTFTEKEIKEAYILRDKQLNKNYYNDIRHNLEFYISKLRGNNFPSYEILIDEEKEKELKKYAEEEDIEKFYNSLGKKELMMLGW